MKKGRPTIKTPELLDDFLDKIMDGRGMREICRADDMPCFQIVCRWLRDDADFMEQYTRARAVQADVLVEELIPLADTATGKNDADAVRVKVQTRQWAAGKLKPKVYGDRINLDHSGSLKIDKVIIEHVNAAPPTDG